jgi:hypothetical protein
MVATEQMGAWCGAHLIEELADCRSFLPFSTDEDNKREGMAFPCGNPEGDHVKHLLTMTLYSHERYSNEAVEEVTEEMKPSLFSADASSSQHKTKTELFLQVLVMREAAPLCAYHFRQAGSTYGSETNILSGQHAAPTHSH